MKNIYIYLYIYELCMYRPKKEKWNDEKKIEDSTPRKLLNKLIKCFNLNEITRCCKKWIFTIRAHIYECVDLCPTMYQVPTARQTVGQHGCMAWYLCVPQAPMIFSVFDV